MWTTHSAHKKKAKERAFLEQMLDDLHWDARIRPGDEPPDFYLEMCDDRVAVEITRVHTGERRHGSPKRQQEAKLEEILGELKAKFLSSKEIQPIDVGMKFIVSGMLDVVRRLPPRECLLNWQQRLLKQLIRLPKLDPYATVELREDFGDGWIVVLDVTGLPRAQVWKACGTCTTTPPDSRPTSLQNTSRRRSTESPETYWHTHRALVVPVFSLSPIRCGSRGSFGCSPARR